MPLRKITIGVNLDGVCADTYGRMREIATEWFGLDGSELTYKVTYGLPEWGLNITAEYKVLHYFAITKRKLFSTCNILPQAGYYLRLLSDKGAKIIPYRFYSDSLDQMVVLQTFDWLDKHRIPHCDLCFVNGNVKVGADIYIDNDPKNVKNLRTEGLYTICFASSTNKDIEQPRVSSWEEVYQLIKEKYISNI